MLVVLQMEEAKSFAETDYWSWQDYGIMDKGNIWKIISSFFFSPSSG